jgi:hypothetical protein
MFHRLPPIDYDPEVGDLCKLNGSKDQAHRFRRRHGVGLIVAKHRAEFSSIFHYEIKWLKSDQHMRFFKDDIIILSPVDRSAKSRGSPV